MDFQINTCCLCLNNQIKDFRHLSDYFEKLSAVLPKLLTEDKLGDCMVCLKCCETIDFVYEFTNRCIKNLNTYLSYKTQNNKHLKVDVTLSDIRNSPITESNKPQKTVANEISSALTCEKDTLNNIYNKLEDTEIKTEYLDVHSEETPFLTVYLNDEGKSVDVADTTQEVDCCSSNQLFKNNAISTITNDDGQQSDLFFVEHQNSEKNMKSDRDLESSSQFIKVEETDINESSWKKSTVNVIDKTEVMYIKDEDLDINTEKLDFSQSEDGKNKQDEFQENLNFLHMTESMVEDISGKNQGNILQTNISNENIEGNTNKRSRAHEYPYECGFCNKEFAETSELGTHTCNQNNKRSHVGRPEGTHSDERFKCDICHKKFATSQALARHISFHTGVKPYECDICNYRFAELHHLVRHKHTHSKEKPYNCDMCSKGFTEPSGLAKHLRTHTGQKSYRCDICNETFTEANSFTTHKLMHTRKKLYKCDECEEIFTELRNLENHKLAHTGESLYRCDVCNKVFTRSSGLAMHKRTHTGDKPYNCDVCLKSFTQSSNLTRHKLTHIWENPNEGTKNSPISTDLIEDTEKPFKCDERFTESSNLAYKHIHTEEKSYVCEECNKSFTDLSNLEKHKLTHICLKLYQCDVCSKEFTRSSGLELHKRTHTGDKPYTCDVCYKGFTQSCNLTRHKLTHTGERPFECMKRCTTSADLAKHKLTHTGQRQYKCDKEFAQSSNLATHKLTHTGEKPYECDVCYKRFAKLGSLVRHKLTHTS